MKKQELKLNLKHLILILLIPAAILMTGCKGETPAGGPGTSNKINPGNGLVPNDNTPGKGNGEDGGKEGPRQDNGEGNGEPYTGKIKFFNRHVNFKCDNGVKTAANVKSKIEIEKNQNFANFKDACSGVEKEVPLHELEVAFDGAPYLFFEGEIYQQFEVEPKDGDDIPFMVCDFQQASPFKAIQVAYSLFSLYQDSGRDDEKRVRLNDARLAYNLITTDGQNVNQYRRLAGKEKIGTDKRDKENDFYSPTNSNNDIVIHTAGNRFKGYNEDFFYAGDAGFTMEVSRYIDPEYSADFYPAKIDADVGEDTVAPTYGACSNSGFWNPAKDGPQFIKKGSEEWKELYKAIRVDRKNVISQKDYERIQQQEAKKAAEKQAREEARDLKEQERQARIAQREAEALAEKQAREAAAVQKEAERLAAIQAREEAAAQKQAESAAKKDANQAKRDATKEANQAKRDARAAAAEAARLEREARRNNR